MKRLLIVIFLLLCLLLSACNNLSVGVIQGADGPTSIIVGENDINEKPKQPIRIANVKGELYYEIDEESDVDARCGVMDGNLTKTAETIEIPKNDGETNFLEGNGYQIGKNKNTIEILINGDWEIFKKIETNSNILKYNYCYIVEGVLPNSHDDSELLVLANTNDISFEEAAYQIFGSNSNKKKDIYVLPIVD